MNILGNSKYIFFLLIIFAVIFEIAADIMFKKWAIINKNYLIIGGLFIYFIGTVFWAFSLRFELLSRAVSIFTILNFIAVVLVGLIIFDENLSPINKIGITLGILSVILIEL